MKRVLLDCDGVLADFIGSVLDAVADEIGIRYTHEDIKEFNFTKALNLDADVARRVKRTISEGPGWWFALAPFPEAIEGVAKLREVANVYIVTSPWNSHPNWLHEREAWLKKHFGIPHSHVVACSAKYIVSGDLLVDDKTDALVKWEDEQKSWWQNEDGTKGETFGVQWQTPHNRLDEWSGRSTRSWSELLEWAR